MLKEYLPLIFSLFVSITYYFSNRFDLKDKSYSKKIVSFAAGVSITYVLLELFPIFTEGAQAISKWLFASILIGFMAHHLIEREIYHHAIRKRLHRMLTTEEHVSSFIYHFVVGFLLVPFAEKSITQAVLFFIPILAYTLVSTLPTEPHISRVKGFLLSAATPLGVIISSIFQNTPLWLVYFLVGLVVGVLLFIVTRHHIPVGRKGEVEYFALGFIIYSIIILSSW